MSGRPQAGDLYVVVDEMPSGGTWGHPFSLDPDTWLVKVEPDYYEVETDGTSLSGPRFHHTKERPNEPEYGYGPEPLERWAVYRVRITDGEATDG